MCQKLLFTCGHFTLRECEDPNHNKVNATNSEPRGFTCPGQPINATPFDGPCYPCVLKAAREESKGWVGRARAGKMILPSTDPRASRFTSAGGVRDFGPVGSRRPADAAVAGLYNPVNMPGAMAFNNHAGPPRGGVVMAGPGNIDPRTASHNGVGMSASRPYGNNLGPASYNYHYPQGSHRISAPDALPAINTPVVPTIGSDRASNQDTTATPMIPTAPRAMRNALYPNSNMAPGFGPRPHAIDFGQDQSLQQYHQDAPRTYPGPTEAMRGRRF